MKKIDINKLFKKREELFEKLSFYNNPPMFNTRNYELHKKRIREQLCKIANILYKELSVDKKNNAF